MRLLLIDLIENDTKNLQDLKAVCAPHEVTIVRPEALDGVQPDSYEAIILSGSYEHNLVWDQPYFLAEIELVRLTDKPVLGICLGFELICYAFGSQLHELTERVTGATVVTPTSEGTKLFQGGDPIKVLEASRWAIDEVPKDLVVLATSETGIEALRHRTRPIYGLQFYPEDFKYASDGKLVVANILDGFRKTKVV